MKGMMMRSNRRRRRRIEEVDAIFNGFSTVRILHGVIWNRMGSVEIRIWIICTRVFLRTRSLLERDVSENFGHVGAEAAEETFRRESGGGFGRNHAEGPEHGDNRSLLVSWDSWQLIGTWTETHSPAAAFWHFFVCVCFLLKRERERENREWFYCVE